MTRLLLLKPYRPDELFVVAQPLGLLAVAAWVRREFRRRGEPLEIRILDLKARRLLPQDALDEILAFEPDVIGISALSCEAEATRALTATLKSHRPDVPIVLGGPHASHDPRRALDDPDLDFVVRAEGEVTFEKLLGTLIAGGDPAAVAGIGLRRDGEVVLTADRAPIENLDELPRPAYDLIDVPAYFQLPRHSRLYAHPEYMTVSSSRGCPYRCVYCHVTMGKKTRFLSAERVVDEIESLVRHHGIREIHWADDIWNLDPRRAKRICDGIVERGLDIRMAFPNGVRGDLFDDELLAKLQAAGAYQITFAPESGSPRIQKYIRKNARLEVLQSVITRAARRGIWCHGFFMVGFPTETEQEMGQTFDFALRSRLSSASFFVVNAHPGTELYEMARELGKNVSFRASSHDYFNPNFQLSEVPTEEVARRIRWTLLRFYLGPRRLLRNIRTIPRKRQLFDLAWDLAHKVFGHFRGRRRDIYQAEGIPDTETVPQLRTVTPYNRV